MKNQEGRLSKEEENRYLKLLKEGTNEKEIREILIKNYLSLVYYIAGRFKNTGFEIEDLGSIGIVGLIKAIDTFKLEHNVQLSTYVSKCITNEILMFLRKNAKYKKNEISIETIIYRDEKKDFCIKDILEDRSKIYESIENREIVKEILEYILNKIQHKNKIYFLYYLGGLTMRELGEKFGISQSYASRKINDTRNKIKRWLNFNKKCSGNENYLITTENKWYKIYLKIDKSQKELLCQIGLDKESFMLLAQTVEDVEKIRR